MKKVYIILLVVLWVLLIGLIVSTAYEMRQRQFHNSQIEILSKQLSEFEQKCKEENELNMRTQFYALRHNASFFGGYPQRQDKEAKEEMQLILNKIRDDYCNDHWDGSDGINSLERKIKETKSQIEFHKGKSKK